MEIFIEYATINYLNKNKGNAFYKGSFDYIPNDTIAAKIIEKIPYIDAHGVVRYIFKSFLIYTTNPIYSTSEISKKYPSLFHIFDPNIEILVSNSINQTKEIIGKIKDTYENLNNSNTKKLTD